MNYTYRQLLAALHELSPEELDLNVTIYDSSREEYYPLNYTDKTDDDDVLDSNHPIMIINDTEEPPKADLSTYIDDVLSNPEHPEYDKIRRKTN